MASELIHVLYILCFKISLYVFKNNFHASFY